MTADTLRHTSARTASLLFDVERADPAEGSDAAQLERPDYFRDLNLDQVVDGILDGLDDYRLQDWYHLRLRDAAAVRYRQEVFGDLEHPPLLAALDTFAGAMRTVRQQGELSARVRHPLQRARWVLEAACTYRRGVEDLRDRLAAATPSSTALRRAGAFLERYAGSPGFVTLAADADAAAQSLDSVRYTLQVKGSRVTVRRYDDGADYSAQVSRTFERFQHGAVKDYRVAFPVHQFMSHVEERVLDRVARLFPDVFDGLAQFEGRHRDFLDQRLAALDREAHFYLSFLHRTNPLRRAGLEFCVPAVSAMPTIVEARDAFDMALAMQITGDEGDGGTVVRNDVALRAPERILVVSGPNQGGKTTFARMVGQLHHLAALGCPVPGTAATLPLCDEILTHFEREEDPTAAGGRLADDLARMQAVLRRTTSHSLVVVNEIFTSTTLEDATFLGHEVVGRLIELGALGVYVTFVDELASVGPATVSMVSTVSSEDPSQRTFRVVRRPADGRAYAVVLAEKYGLTEPQLRERLRR